MVMSGLSTDRKEEPLDWSFQSRSGELLRRGNHPRSNFRRCILDNADLTEGNFVDSDFRRASMVEVDLMKSSFDNCDFRGADLRKARLNFQISEIALSKEQTSEVSVEDMQSGKVVTGGMRN